MQHQKTVAACMLNVPFLHNYCFEFVSFFDTKYLHFLTKKNTTGGYTVRSDLCPQPWLVINTPIREHIMRILWI